MDFISKLLQRKSPKQGGCGNSNSVASTPVTCSDPRLPLTTETSECDLPVQFTRQFVEEVVENVQCVSDKTANDVPHPTTEEAPHLKFEAQESLPGSLPDLLLPEAAFKKQSDTDTDTTEYESAAETDPPDGLSHSSSIVAEDSNVFEESVHASAPTSEAQKAETVETVNSNILSHGDISILCADLNALNLNSPILQDCTEHSLAHEVFSSGVVGVSSRSLFNSINAEESYVKKPQETETDVPELLEANQKVQSLNEKNNLCPTSDDLSSVCNDSIAQSHYSVETNLERHSLDTDAHIACINEINVDVGQTDTKIAASVEVPKYISVDAIINCKELPKLGIDAELDSEISGVTEGEGHVISEIPLCDEINTTSQDLNTANDTFVCVHESQDTATTVADLRSNLPDNSGELSVPLLQDDGASVQIDDKDYKSYENIIEISRLQEKDLEKECCDGGTIKKENYSSEGTDFSNLCYNKEELIDTVSETPVSDIPEFGNISLEAEKVAEEIFNVSQEIEEEVSNINVVDLKCDMEDQIFLNMDDKIDPFAPKSALRHSPPPVPRTNSPNSSSSRGSSPAKRYSIEKSSPKTKSKSGTSTPGKESSLSDSDTPRSRFKASDSPSSLPKENDVITETTSAKHCIQEKEDLGSGAPLGAETSNTAATSVATGNNTYSQTDVSREHAAVNISSGSADQMPDLQRESLYVKFDPLWSTPTKSDHSLPQVDRISLERQEDVAVEPERKEEDVLCPGSNQALAYIDKLISLSPTVMKPEKSAEKIKDRTCSHNNQSEISVPEKESVKKVNNPEDNSAWNNNHSPEVSQEAEMLNELQELRNMVLKQEQSYTEKIKILEEKIESLEIKLKEKDEKESKLNKKIAEMTEGQEQISIIMEEYERTIAGLVYEKEQEKQRFEHEKSNLMKEKDTVSGHLENIEIAFSDVHRKYERSKDIIQGIKNNEETLRASLAEYEATIKQQEQKYDFLKSYATSQLESANQELESLRRSHQAESAKLHAMLKKAEIKASSLEEMLEQKIKENQELTAICDELIGKVGSSE